MVRCVAANETLFENGDLKTCLYYVRSGAIGLYERQWSGQHSHIDFAFPGDLIGLGYLERHACFARALTATELESLPLEDMARLVRESRKAQAELHSRAPTEAGGRTVRRPRSFEEQLDAG